MIDRENEVIQAVKSALISFIIADLMLGCACNIWKSIAPPPTKGSM